MHPTRTIRRIRPAVLSDSFHIACCVMAIALAFLFGCSAEDGSSSATTTSSAAPTSTTSPPSPKVPLCSTVFAPGRITEQVIADYNSNPCTDKDGSTFLTMVVSRECPDGTTHYYVEGYGTGISNQPWQPPTDQGSIDATAC